MKRWFGLLVVLATVAAACGGGDDGGDGETTQPAPTTTQVTAAPTTQPAPTTTAGPSTTEPSPSGTVTDLAITEVVFGDHFTITNLGSETVSVDGLWVCNRPSYIPLSGVIAPNESLDVPASSLGGLTAGGAEVALYSSNSFGDAGSILDYVSWGGGGGRGSVAAEAGLWPSGETVTVGGDSISAPGGGSTPADWS